MMAANEFTVEATLDSDGKTLNLDDLLPLPPGRVVLTVRAAKQQTGPAMVEVLEAIHRAQQQRGHRPMTAEEMAAEIADMRRNEDEYEQRWQQITSNIRPDGSDKK
jgi:hypothetical protein